MQGLVGNCQGGPVEGVVLEVVDRGLAGRVLAELFDLMLDHGTGVVAAPSGQGVDARDVRQYVRFELDFVVSRSSVVSSVL